MDEAIRVDAVGYAIAVPGSPIDSQLSAESGPPESVLEADLQKNRLLERLAHTVPGQQLRQGLDDLAPTGGSMQADTDKVVAVWQCNLEKMKAELKELEGQQQALGSDALHDKKESANQQGKLLNSMAGLADKIKKPPMQKSVLSMNGEANALVILFGTIDLLCQHAVAIDIEGFEAGLYVRCAVPCGVELGHVFRVHTERGDVTLTHETPSRGPTIVTRKVAAHEFDMMPCDSDGVLVVEGAVGRFFSVPQGAQKKLGMIVDAIKHLVASASGKTMDQKRACVEWKVHRARLTGKKGSGFHVFENERDSPTYYENTDYSGLGAWCASALINECDESPITQAEFLHVVKWGQMLWTWDVLQLQTICAVSLEKRFPDFAAKSIRNKARQTFCFERMTEQHQGFFERHGQIIKVLAWPAAAAAAPIAAQTRPLQLRLLPMCLR